MNILSSSNIFREAVHKYRHRRGQNIKVPKKLSPRRIAVTMVGHDELRVILHRFPINVVGLASFCVFYSKLRGLTFGNFAQVVGRKDNIQQSIPLSQCKAHWKRGSSHRPSDGFDGLSTSRRFFFFTKRDVWNIIPSYPTAVRPCSIALAALLVTQVSVE